MAITIYSNISSLMAQRRLNQSTASLNRSYERLSSGLRINRASDDAAGLAIADNLNAQARVYAQGVRNLSDGVAVLNIADAAIAELTNVVVRIRELSAQSANGTLGYSQRRAVDEEAQALSDEFTRIVQSTEFNGASILTSDYGELSLQAGYGENAAITSDFGGAVGDGTFGANTIYNAGPIYREVIAVDVNNDGAIDAVSVSQTLNALGVFLNNGDGTFGAISTFDAGSGSNFVEWGDFNSDGAVDLVTTNFNSDDISVFIGNGDGTFESAQTFAATNLPNEVQMADVDADGRTDLVVSGIDEIVVLRGLGNG